MLYTRNDHGARARDLPRPRRHARGLPGVRRDRLPRPAVRRRGRAAPALRSADRRGAGRPRAHRHLAGDALRDRPRDRSNAPSARSARARGPLRGARGRGQAARVAPPAPAHPVRHRDVARARLLQRHRELLAHPRRPQAGRAALLPARLLPRRLRLLHRRVAPDRAADRRHVRGRPLAQADARRSRLSPALRARQPPADVRGVPRPDRAARVRLGHSRRLRAARTRPASSSRSSARRGSSTPRSRCGSRRTRSTT